MGHKVLKDHAFTFCQMFMGWRMGEDLDTFSKLPDGQLTIDVLTGNCEHDSAGTVQTYIGPEIAAWFAHRLEQHHIESGEILLATLTVQIARPTPPAKGKRGITFHWKCKAQIRTSDRLYDAELAEPHPWIPMLRSAKKDTD